LRRPRRCRAAAWTSEVLRKGTRDERVPFFRHASPFYRTRVIRRNSLTEKGGRMPALIEAEALKKSFGSIKAVDGISLTVTPGEVLGFLGPNGAGKSTTMKMITGFLEPDSGTARIAGHDMQEEPLAAKARLGYLPEG